MSNKDTLVKNKLKYENSIFKTNICGDCVVIEYRGANDITVRFEDTGFETTVAMYSLQKGEVKDRLKPSFYGVGVVGEAFVKNDTMYNTWMCMLNRCYGAAHVKENSTYKDCSVSDNFKYYPYFKEWCDNQIGFNVLDDKGKTFALDKDILVKGNKVYSEYTCCFVPPEINSLITRYTKNSSTCKGVYYNTKLGKFSAHLLGKYIGLFATEIEAFYAYKEAKETYIKEVANKWKDKIDPRVYEALMAWAISIDD